MTSYTDKACSEMELQAAVEFWRLYHTVGARRRLRAAIAYFRAWHR